MTGAGPPAKSGDEKCSHVLYNPFMVKTKRMILRKPVQEKANIEDVYDKLVEINSNLADLLAEVKDIKERMPEPDASSHS